MAENEINITDMIKALKCVASQDSEGDCYCDHFNAHLTCEQFGDDVRLDEKHMSCGGNLKDTQNCPYHQNTYGVCFEDGELFWLKDIVSILEEIQAYRAIGTIEELQSLKENSFFNFDSPVVRVDEKSYNKAIEDFVVAIRKAYASMQSVSEVERCTANTITMGIAEQMKGEKA